MRVSASLEYWHSPSHSDFFLCLPFHIDSCNDTKQISVLESIQASGLTNPFPLHSFKASHAPSPWLHNKVTQWVLSAGWTSAISPPDLQVYWHCCHRVG